MFIKQQIRMINERFPSVAINVVETSNKGNYIEVSEIEGVPTYINYIEKKKGLNRAYSYFKSYWNTIMQVFNERGTPTFVHVHVAYKAAFLAWVLKKRYGLIYIVSEHFTALTKDSKHRNKRFITTYSRYFSNRSHLCLPISRYLRDSLIMNGYNNTKVIYNMIDDDLFNSRLKFNRDVMSTRFIHVSSLNNEHKNYKTILNAFSEAKRQAPNISLTIVSHNEENLEKAKQFISSKFSHLKVFIKGRMSPRSLSIEMQKHDSLLMYSNYETFSMVIAEALASGLRVIASDVGGPREIITEESLGKLVPLNNVDLLSNAIVEFAQYEDTNSDIRAQLIIDKFGRKKFLDEMTLVYNEIFKTYKLAK